MAACRGLSAAAREDASPAPRRPLEMEKVPHKFKKIGVAMAGGRSQASKATAAPDESRSLGGRSQRGSRKD